MKVRIYDDQFPHALTMANGGLDIKSSNFEWTREDCNSQFAFVTESWFNRIHLVKEKVKIAIIIEPQAFHPQAYHWIRYNYNLFDFVLTYDTSLANISPKFVFYPYGGSWIFKKDWQVYPKTKNVSIVASSKRELEGHILRHSIVGQIKGIDVYGNGYNPIDYLLEAYKDYRFTIVVENAKYDYWITEKLINPMLCGTIPIYWGCPSINNLFKNIIQFNGVNDLSQLLNTMNFEEEYSKSLETVNSNFIESQKYSITEDWLFYNFFPILTNHLNKLK